ncbi:MAG: DUF4173 domain-containing protein [Chitinophagales bacterium]
MKTTPTHYLPALLMSLVFYFLFRNETPGINVLIFLLLSAVSLAILQRGIFRLTVVKVTFITTLLLSVLLLVFNTDISIISCWLLFAMMVGFIHQYRLRSAGSALLTAAMGLLLSPLSWWEAIKTTGHSSLRISKMLKYIQLSFIPLFVLLVFFGLYSFADPEFSFVSNQLLDKVSLMLEHFFTYVSPDSIAFFILSLAVTASIFFNRDIQLIVKRELLQSDFLQRKRKKVSLEAGIEWWQLFFRKSLLSLKNEYQRGIILLALVNALLLFVNAVDIKMVWFENTIVTSPSSRSQAVHESTYLLLFSIAIAMAILLFFFRGNINFLRNNKRLLHLSYLWIAQNALLAFTAGIRNYYYIRDYGLAYKRIGVIFFLLLTLFSLLILFLKIRDKRSFFYFYRMEGWAICGLLLLMSCFNWDPMIASYNLSHFDNQHLDRKFLMTLSHRALPVLISHEERFPEITDPIDLNLSPFQNWMKLKSESFITSYESTSWPSWNYADDRVYHFLKEHRF